MEFLKWYLFRENVLFVQLCCKLNTIIVLLALLFPKDPEAMDVVVLLSFD